MEIQAAGLPWFAEDDYESFRRVLPDRRWHPTYADWLSAAEQNFERIQTSGVMAIKAHVRSNEFVAWCEATSRDVDAHALLAWGNETAIRAHQNKKGN